MNFNQTEGKNKHIFCLWFAEKKLKRCDDIITKNIMFVDIDIRLSYYEKHNLKVLSQDELQQEIDKIIGVLKRTDFEITYSVIAD